jgi:thiol-disulfide isomerase/thioredoxin
MALLCPHSNAAGYRRLCVSLFSAVLMMIPGAARAQAGQTQTDPQKTQSASAGGPTDPKAVKTFQMAIEALKKGQKGDALDAFRKAFKQDNGQCRQCLTRAYRLAMDIGAYKDAEEVARQWLPLAASDSEKSAAHYSLGESLLKQGMLDKKDKYFTASRDEFQQAIALRPAFAQAQFFLGTSLAYLHQDDEARAAFQKFLDQDTKNASLHDRAERFVDRIELARARMAPPFELTTLDGRHITMDSLAGKVVLIDFWATWCGPCRDSIPHMRSIARKFDGQPFVMLSISQDSDDAKWKDFVGKNSMTWMQYRDGSVNGKISKLFNVTAIPATFSIDADGVLEDQHVGDASIEGKLKKMIARAVEIENRKPAQSAAAPAEAPKDNAN